MALSGNVGDTADFAYTGAMQSIAIPSDGIYRLTCYGPGGGVNGGTGGWSEGYKILKKGQVIYVGVGQCGGGANDYGNRFNGGRDGSDSGNPAHWSGKHPGAGCTHMATADGELAALSGNRSAVLLVAGGAGAGATNSGIHGVGNGGDGGGETGGNAQYTGWNYGGFNEAGTGATQTSGYAFGVGEPCNNVGAGNNQDTRTGGGAGWYGGRSGTRGGGAGSGYVGGVPLFTYQGVAYPPENLAGQGYAGENNGFARIEMIRKLTLPVIFNGTTLEKIIFNGTEITSLIFNGKKLF